MICVSIADSSLENNIRILKSLKFAEIRIDKTSLSTEEVKTIFSLPLDLIATFRGKNTDEEKRKKILKAAISSGASYVDVDIRSSDDFKKEIINSAKVHGCKTIVSYHNYEKTPDKGELVTILNNCFQIGADIAKIACKVNSSSDNARVLSLYNSPNSGRIIAIGMGEIGKITRIVSLFLGAPFTYASLEQGKETADGQIDRIQLKKILDILKNV